MIRLRKEVEERLTSIIDNVAWIANHEKVGKKDKEAILVLCFEAILEGMPIEDKVYLLEAMKHMELSRIPKDIRERVDSLKGELGYIG